MARDSQPAGYYEQQLEFLQWERHTNDMLFLGCLDLTSVQGLLPTEPGQAWPASARVPASRMICPVSEPGRTPSLSSSPGEAGQEEDGVQVYHVRVVARGCWSL